MSFNIDSIANKIILEKLRLRCNMCYAEYSDDAYVSVVNKLFTHKTFFIYDKKVKKNKLYQNQSLICSEKSVLNNNSTSVFEALRVKYSKISGSGFGNVVQIELCCEKCYNTRFCEINLEKLSDQNHWL